MSLGVFNLLVAAFILMPVLSIGLSLTAYYKIDLASSIHAVPSEKESAPLVAKAPLPGNTVAGEKPAPAATEFAPEPPVKTGTEPAPEPAPSDSKVLLENVQLSELEDVGGFKVRFNISRTESSSDKLTGFVFVIYKVNGEYQTIPENSKIKNGMPAHFKRGENFFIKVKRPFEIIIPYAKSAVSEMHVIIYSSKGNLLLKQKVDIK